MGNFKNHPYIINGHSLDELKTVKFYSKTFPPFRLTINNWVFFEIQEEIKSNGLNIAVSQKYVFEVLYHNDIMFLIHFRIKNIQKDDKVAGYA